MLFRSAIKPNTKLIFSETPANPVLTLCDLEEISKIAKEINAVHVVDATFATPIMLRPLDHGADMVIQSLTKYYEGHNIMTGGAVLSKALFEVKGEFASRGLGQPRERVYRVHHLPFYQKMKRDPRLLKRIIRQVLEAIRALSDHAIVHSDLKPENLLLDGAETGREMACEVRLCDFGSAFIHDQPEALTLATPEYMPPEALETYIQQIGRAHV